MRHLHWTLVGLLASLGMLGGCASEEPGEDLVSGEHPGEHAEETNEADLTSRLPAQVRIESLAKVERRRVLTKAIAALDGASLVRGARILELRQFRRAGKDARLVMNAESLATSVVSGDALVAGSREQTFSGTAYDRLQARSRDGVVQSFAGGGQAAPRVTLTVDMCQSSKPWDKALFDWAVSQGERLGRAFPIAIAMTGGWAGKHPTEFRQLQSWENSGKLAIEWINHSMTHPLHCAGNSCAFLTSSSVDFAGEVLGLEQVLLEQGEVPSAFFRFPGLVHNQSRRTQLRSFGMVGLDADAWLAKGEAIHDGGVILLHGNGNEPAGIRMFLSAMEGRYAGGEASGKIRFVGLSQAMR